MHRIAVTILFAHAIFLGIYAEVTLDLDTCDFYIYNFSEFPADAFEIKMDSSVPFFAEVNRRFYSSFSKKNLEKGMEVAWPSLFTFRFDDPHFVILKINYFEIEDFRATNFINLR